MKKLRIALRLRSYFCIKQHIKRTRSIAGLALALVVLVYGSELPSYSRNSADYIKQPNALSLNQWTQILPNALIVRLAIDPTNPNNIYAGTDIGVLFKTTDGGATWTSSNIASSGFPTSLAIDFVNPSNVYAGTSAGLFKSTDSGATWRLLGSVPASYLVMDPQSSNTLYACSFNANTIWRTTDGGANWSVLQTGDLRLIPSGWAINPANSQIIYAPASYPNSSFSLFKSTDGGGSWSTTGLVSIHLLNDTAIDPFNTDVVYASFDHELFKSRDGGASWLNISEGLDLFIYSSITSIETSPTDPNTLYLGTTNDADESIGAIQSTNGGASWTEFNYGLYPYINDLEIDSTGTNLYAATFHHGVYRYQFAPTCAAQVSPSSQFFSSMGGSGSVNLTTGNACSWAVSNNADWITLTSPSTGAGPATVTFEVRENFTASPRSTTLLIAGQSFTIVQDGGSGEECDYLISARFQTFSAAGGAATINVSTTSQCAWQAVSNAGWITITSNGVGIGNAIVTFSVAPNTTGAGRKGSITIAGQSFSVKQKGN